MLPAPLQSRFSVDGQANRSGVVFTHSRASGEAHKGRMQIVNRLDCMQDQHNTWPASITRDSPGRT